MTTMTDAVNPVAHILSRLTADSRIEPCPCGDCKAAARLFRLARIGAKVIAADEARTTYAKFDKKALDRLQQDVAALASVGE